MSVFSLPSLGLIEPGSLVIYTGSIQSAHGLWLAIPCACGVCRAYDLYGLNSAPRYALIDPWGEQDGPFHARGASLTLSAANG